MTQEYFKNTIFIFKDEMYRFAKSFLLSSDEAQDVVQELMMKLWQQKDGLSTYQNIKAYIMRAVKNECLNRLKHEVVKQNYSKVQLYRPELYKMEVNNLKDHIIAFISQLPEKQKRVIHLKDVEEYEISEISEILEMEENAVRINLMRARNKIKEKISQLMAFENKLPEQPER